MDHKCFFEQGISLNFDLSKPPSEAEIRNAIGRVYYYTYHEALALVQANVILMKIYNELKDEYPSLHKRLFQTFVKYAIQTQNLIYGTISRHLSNLHTMRCTADYNLMGNIKDSDFFSFLANLESLKIEIFKIESNFFNIDTSLKSKSVVQTDLDCGKAVVKKKLRILE